MNPAENRPSLYCSPRYTSGNGIWYNSFNDALKMAGSTLTWNLSSILSMISFHHPCGDSTLIREIKKEPWMSVANDNGIQLQTIPPHGYHFEHKDKIASQLFGLLVDEMTAACHGYKKVYLLLSGGLDSRIVACALHKGILNGSITSDITALTWGLPDTRDVRIAELVAGELGFKWKNIELFHSTFFRNIDLVVQNLGCMTNPYHLHGIAWLVENIGKDAIVIAGSYGDGVGRGEYSGRCLLELNLMKPANRFDLIRSEYIPALKDQLMIPLNSIRERYTWQHRHEICEVEQQSQYMRNLIAHSLDIINQYSNLYQAFTLSDVYSYMWMIHPSFRNNSVYARILGTYSKGIAELPWARTNKSLTGLTKKLDPSLGSGFHLYRKWISGPLYDELYSKLDFAFFDELKIFDNEQIRKISGIIRTGSEDFHVYNIFLWLISLSEFNSMLENQQIKMILPDIRPSSSMVAYDSGNQKNISSWLKKHMKWVYDHKTLIKKTRRKALRMLFLVKHFPVKNQ